MKSPKETFNTFSMLLLSKTLGENERKEIAKKLKEYNEALKAKGLPEIQMIGDLSGNEFTIDEAILKIEQGDHKVIEFFKELAEVYLEIDELLED